MPVSVSLLATDKYDILLNLAQLLLATEGHVRKPETTRWNDRNEKTETTEPKQAKRKETIETSETITINEGQPQNTESGNHNLEPESGNRSLELLILRMTTEITHFSNVQSINIGKNIMLLFIFFALLQPQTVSVKKHE